MNVQKIVLYLVGAGRFHDALFWTLCMLLWGRFENLMKVVEMVMI
jgi:hypothetical protein